MILSAGREMLQMIEWTCLKRVTASYDFHEGSKTSGCIGKYFFRDNLGEIFAHRKKQGIFNACVIWEHFERRG